MGISLNCKFPKDKLTAVNQQINLQKYQKCEKVFIFVLFISGIILLIVILLFPTLLCVCLTNYFRAVRPNIQNRRKKNWFLYKVCCSMFKNIEDDVSAQDALVTSCSQR